MSTFDPDAFLHTQTEKALDTKSTPVPKGEWPATIDKVVVRNPKEGVYAMDIIWIIDDESVRQATGLEEPRARQSMFLDIDESGTLAFGKNRNLKLGRVREAVGQNQDGMPWAPAMLEGAGPAMVTVDHRPDNDDPSIVYAEVKRVNKMR